MLNRTFEFVNRTIPAVAPATLVFDERHVAYRLVAVRRSHGVGNVSLQRRLKATPSIDAVADLARVSKATVSRVVNGQVGKVSDAPRRRVQAAVKKLNYVPSRAGSALRTGRSEIVALVIPDRFDTY